MQAVEMTGVGEPSVLRLNKQCVAPEIASPSQIKVRLIAAGVNPIDTKIRSRGLFFDAQPPAILGCDGAGEVIEVGSQVDRFRIGDRVWFCHGGLGREPGNYAEFHVIDQALAQPMPPQLSFEEAAAAPLVLITAWEALFLQARLDAAETVLIHAGAGGVGHVAIQLAKAHGARVLTTVGTPENAEFVRELGADEVIDYRREDLLQQVMRLTDGQGVAVCLDSVGPQVFRNSISAMAPYGRLVTLLDPGAPLELAQARTKNLQIAFTLMLSPALLELEQPQLRQGEILNACAKLIAQQRLKIHVSHAYPLDAAANAHRAQESGHTRGKLVLRIP